VSESSVQKWRFWAGLALAWALFALLAFCAPLHGRDWARVAALASNLPGGVGDAFATILAENRLVHVLVAASAATALLLALTTHALGRLPHPQRSHDGLAVLATGALVWLTVPAAGATLVAHATVGETVVGLAALAWLLAAYRIGDADGAGGAERTAGMAVLGFVAGAAEANRPAATVATFVVAAWMIGRVGRGARVRAWMWTGLAALGFGTAVAWLAAPPAGAAPLRGIYLLLELDRFARKAGEAAAIVAVLAFVTQARRTSVTLAGATIRRLLWCIPVAVAVELLAVFAPGGYTGDAALLAALAPFVVVAVALVDALTGADGLVRRIVATGALAVNLVAFALATATLLQVRQDFDARSLALLRTPPGGVATISPYRAPAGTWFAGEDLTDVGTRALVAARHGLTEIVFAGRVSGFEPAQPYALRGPAGLVFVRHLPVARQQLADIAARDDVELRVEGLDWPERHDRPVLAARASAVAHAPDTRGRALFELRAPAAPDAEVYVVHDGAVVASERRGRQVSFQPSALGYHLLVVCDADTCDLVEALDVRP